MNELTNYWQENPLDAEQVPLGIRLRALSLEGFRLFKNVPEDQLRFDERLTVLIGENGAGKTSLLEAVAESARALALRFMGLKEESLPSGLDGLDVNNDTGACAVSAWFDLQLGVRPTDSSDEQDEEALGLPQDTDSPDEQDEEALVLPPDNKLRAVPLRLRGSFYLDSGKPTSRIALDLEGAADGLALAELANEAEQHPRNDKRALPLLIFYGSESMAARPGELDSRRGYRRRHNIRAELLYGEALSPKALQVDDFIEWYDDQYRYRHINPAALPEIVRDFDRFTEAVLSVLNADQPADQPNFRNLRMNYDGRGRSTLVLDSLMADKWTTVEFSQLSAGQRRALALAGDLCRRADLAKAPNGDPFQAQGIVLIDEVDLHLHPRWQRAVLPKLLELFPRLQFVASTHSPFVLGELPARQIRVIERATVSHVEASYGQEVGYVSKVIMGAKTSNLDEEIFNIRDRVDYIFPGIDDSEMEEAEKDLDKAQEDLDLLMQRIEGLGDSPMEIPGILGVFTYLSGKRLILKSRREVLQA